MLLEKANENVNQNTNNLNELSYPLDMGTESCFDYIYQTYFAPLCTFAHRYVGDDALDIVNNLFVKLWSSQTILKNENHAQSFLYLCVKNACLDFLKTSGRSKRRETEYALISVMSDTDMEMHKIHNEYYADIYREMMNLPPQCSKILKMSYLEGLSNEEVADQLKLSIQTIKNQKHKGLKILRSRLIALPKSYHLFLILFTM